MHKKIFALIVIDQITKLIFSSRDFFLGPIHVHLVKNFGLIFSLNFGTLTNLIIIGAALGFFIYYYYTHPLPKIIFIMIFGGAISNLIDRLYFGYVRDLFDLGLGFTFNLADVMIIVGLIIILFSSKYETNLGD